MASTIFYRLRKRAQLTKAAAGEPVVTASYVASVECADRNFLPLVYLCHLRKKVGISWENLGELLDDEFLPMERAKPAKKKRGDSEEPTP